MSMVKVPARSEVAPRVLSLNMSRLAGACGLLFLVLVVFQNVLRAVTAPANDATPEQILGFAGRQAWTVDVQWVTFVIGLPALFLFASELARQAAQRAAGAEIWGRLGMMFTVLIAVLFGMINIVNAVVVALRDTLAADPSLTRTLWYLHNAIFTLNLVAVAGALLGLGLAARRAGFVPAWFGWLAGSGAALLTIATLPAIAEIKGSALLGIGLIGYLCWLVFLVMVSIRLLRQ